MNIPDERMSAARWVYQFSVFSCMVNIMCVPYNALITSHEKMTVYAVLSIIEAVLKLIIVWMLVMFDYDKLILYAILMFVVSLMIRIMNQAYTIRTFKDVHFVKCKDLKTLKEMGRYAGWSLVGSLATILFDQGVNVLLNIFFGPVINAARGVSMQVKNAVVNFSNSFQQALNPQINKSYASGNIEYMHSLIFAASKYTYFIMFIMILPISLLIRQILSVWLVDVPEHTAIFTILILIICILQAIGQPISNAAGANGNIRNFQVIIGGINLSLLPIAWVLLKIYPIPEIVFFLHILVNIIAQIARLVIVRPMISLSLRKYAKNVVLPCFSVTILSLPIPLGIRLMLSDGIVGFILVLITSLLCSIFAIYYVGMSVNERQVVSQKIKRIIVRMDSKRNRIQIDL